MVESMRWRRDSVRSQRGRVPVRHISIRSRNVGMYDEHVHSKH